MNAPQDLRARTKEYALRVIRLFRALPRKDSIADVRGKQLLRSATSVAAHYREAGRAKSDPISSANSRVRSRNWNESDLWLELLADSGVMKPSLVHPLRDETNELIVILVTLTKNVKARRR